MKLQPASLYLQWPYMVILRQGMSPLSTRCPFCQRRRPRSTRPDSNATHPDPWTSAIRSGVACRCLNIVSPPCRLHGSLRGKRGNKQLVGRYYDFCNSDTSARGSFANEDASTGRRRGRRPVVFAGFGQEAVAERGEAGLT